MSGVKHTPGTLSLCVHLEQAKARKCECGYRGGIWGLGESMPWGNVNLAGRSRRLEGRRLAMLKLSTTDRNFCASLHIDTSDASSMTPN